MDGKQQPMACRGEEIVGVGKLSNLIVGRDEYIEIAREGSSFLAELCTGAA